MSGYGGLLSLVILLSLAGWEVPLSLLGVTAIAGAFTALYSGFLFNQAKGRDLWQSPVLPVHLLAHAVVAGAASLALVSFFSEGLEAIQSAILRILAGGLALNLITMGAEFLSRPATEDAEAAAASIIRGRFRHRFWWVCFAGGNLIPVLLLRGDRLAPAAFLALVGVYVFEDLFVKAGQDPPLA
jgi:formate-dependent nitrite reductase membrane component NrfD